jgi:hypothetical protein
VSAYLSGHDIGPEALEAIRKARFTGKDIIDGLKIVNYSFFVT